MSYYDYRAKYAFNGRGFAQIKDVAIVSYGYRWHITIHQAIGIYMHWVILDIPGRIQFPGHKELSN